MPGLGDGRRVERSFPKVGLWELISWGISWEKLRLITKGEVALVWFPNWGLWWVKDGGVRTGSP